MLILRIANGFHEDSQFVDWHYISIIGIIVYTRLGLGGRGPLWGIGVTSLTERILKP